MSCRIDRKARNIQHKDIKFGADGDFYIYPSEFEQDFRIANDDYDVRGEYWQGIQKSRVYPKRHESIEELITTCTHETLHHCFTDVIYGIHAKEGIEMEVWQEHWAIRQIAWAEESIQKEFDYYRNEAIRELES